MTAIVYLGFTLLGLSVGSFLNLCMDRLPAGGSILRPGSHCDSCQRQLGVADLVPVLSYVWLGGRCRYCGARIPLRLPLVELATAVIFALLAWHYWLGLDLFIALVYASLFLVVFVIDLEQRLILDVVVVVVGLIVVLKSPKLQR